MKERLIDAAVTLAHSKHTQLFAIGGGAAAAFAYNVYLNESKSARVSSEEQQQKAAQEAEWARKAKQAIDTRQQDWRHFLVWGAIGLTLGSAVGISVVRMRRTQERSEFISYTLRVLGKDSRVRSRLGRPLVPASTFEGQTSSNTAIGYFQCRGPATTKRNIDEVQPAVVNIDAEYSSGAWNYDKLVVVLPTSSYQQSKANTHSVENERLLNDINNLYPEFKPGQVIQIYPTSTTEAPER